MPNEPATYTALSANCQWQGFKSTQDGVHNGTIRPWAHRLPKLVSIIKDAHAALVMTQEVGHDEAAQIAERLGSSWSYQRNGLAAIFWSDHWKLEDPPVNQSRDWQLTPYGQFPGGRTLIACRLRHTQTGQYIWAASCHLASNSSWGLSALKAATARRRQAQEVAKHLHGYRQILLGGDLNSRGSLPGTPRAVLKADGWSFMDPFVRSIDAVGAKSRVTLKSVSVVELGDASDHNGRLIRFQIVDPTPKD